MWNALKKLIRGKKGCGHSELPPQEELRLAEEIVRQGDLPHAAFHAANALSHDPTNSVYLATLDRILDIAPDPLSLYEPNKDGGMAFPQGAARAYVLRRLLRHDEALQTLYSVIAARPDLSYIEWAIDWVRDANIEPTLGFFAAWMQQAREETLDQQKAKPTLDMLPTLIDAVLATERLDESGGFYAVSCGLLRRVGYPQKAIELARLGYAAKPTYFAAIALGSALRATNPRAAIEAFRKAAEHDSSDNAAWLDIGDIAWERGWLDEARQAYSYVCSREPEHAWAYPSLLAMEWDRTGSDADREALTAFVERATDKQRGQYLCHLRFRLYTGSFLTPPGEAVVNLGIQLAEEVKSEPISGIESVSISRPESPSAITSVAREFKKQGIAETFSVSFETVPRPSPLQPRRPVRLALWRFEGTVGVPGVAPPPAAVAEAVAELARTPYGFVPWRTLASQTSLTIADAPAIAASMVHPIPAPDEMAEWDWTQRTVIAAAFLLAVVDQDSLIEILNGPMDWSVWAAALALAGRAEVEPDHALAYRLLPELQGVLQHWDSVATPEFLHPLLASILLLPNLDDRSRIEAEKRLKRLLETD